MQIPFSKKNDNSLIDFVLVLNKGPRHRLHLKAMEKTKPLS